MRGLAGCYAIQYWPWECADRNTLPLTQCSNFTYTRAYFILISDSYSTRILLFRFLYQLHRETMERPKCHAERILIVSFSLNQNSFVQIKYQDDNQFKTGIWCFFFFYVVGASIFDVITNRRMFQVKIVLLRKTQ